MKIEIGIAIAIVGLILLLGCLLLFFGWKKKSSSKTLVDTDFLNRLWNALGSKENISEAKVDHERLKLTVKDLEAVQFDVLKEMSPSGVFVMGNQIKIRLQIEAEVLVRELNLK